MAIIQPVSQEGAASFNDDRRPALYATMVIFLVLNNGSVFARLFSQHRTYSKVQRWLFVEDVFIILGGILIDVIIGNLLASTHFGLGLHTFRIEETDPHTARNISNVFRHVWICMVLFSSALTAIKLSLLFFYRRVFLVNQRWLKIAWWANLGYIILWVIGSTGFYLFQCWPVQWYYIRYYEKAHMPTPGNMHGQCNATKVENVAIPVIFSLFSDVALLLLPVTTILKLQMELKRKIAIAGIFAVGGLACLLGLARLIELEVDTDDKTDPSYGVVIFLILSAAEAVCALMCACLPVVGPQIFREVKAHTHHNISSSSSKNKRSGRNTSGSSKLGSSNTLGKGFHMLGGESGDLSDETPVLGKEEYGLQDVEREGGIRAVGDGTGRGIPLHTVTHVEAPQRAASMPQPEEGAGIVVRSEVHITRKAEPTGFGQAF